MRRDAGLELTDRIVLTLPEDGDLRCYEDWIKAETLATRIEAGPALGIERREPGPRRRRGGSGGGCRGRQRAESGHGGAGLGQPGRI